MNVLFVGNNIYLCYSYFLSNSLYNYRNKTLNSKTVAILENLCYILFVIECIK